MSEYPCGAAILAATSYRILPVRRVEKSYFLVILLGKIANYVNLTILAVFFAITRMKIIAATFRNMEQTRLDALNIYVVKIFLLKLIFRKLYSKN